MQLVVRGAYVRLWWMHAQNLERRGVVAPFVLAFLCPFHYFDLLTVIAAMRVCVLVRFLPTQFRLYCIRVAEGAVVASQHKKNMHLYIVVAVYI